MRRLSATLVSTLIVMLLAACTAAAPSPAPADAPAAAPAAETVSEAAPEAETTDLEALTEHPWQWVSFTNSVEAFDVNMPAGYTLTFKEDGIVDIVADCNNASGSYTADGSSLAIEIGPMTAAACPPESRSDQFVKLLDSAALYFFQDGNLYIDLFADGGTMAFAPAPADILGDDGEGALAGAQAELAATLGNLSYTGIVDDEPITLTDGLYSYTEGDSAAQPIVRLLGRLVAHGDLDGDGNEDAVALIEHDTSGTGRFTYLVPVLDIWTAPAPAAALMLGDRIQMESLAIVDGQVVAEYVAQGPGDGQCCPTYNVRSVYNWQDGGLVESSREEVSKVALFDLDGTNWRLVDLGEGQAPLPDTEITLQFDGSAISGSAGCNRYNGEITASEEAPQSIMVGRIATTMMACEEPIATQEADYLARLGGAVMWGYDGGLLALAYETTDNGAGYLLFDPQALAADASAADSAGASGAAFGDAWEAVACDTLGIRPEIAELADCGYVTVPENRAAGTDKTIQLAVVRIRSTAETPGAPVILGTGGPGGDGLGRLKADPSFLSAHANILAARDWIGFTQRGTAGARPELGCPEFDRVPLDAAMQGLSLEANLELRKTALQVCIDRLVAEGVDLTAYNSVENAADAVDILDTLGFDKFYYYGQSYGTMLGQYLLKDHGDRLLGIILDGIAPLTHKTWPSITDFPAAYQRVFAACAADAACAAAYPEPEAALAAGLQALDANPPSLTVKTAEGDLTVSVDSTLAMRALFLTLYTPGGYAAVPWLAYELSNGNSAPLASNIGLLFGDSDTARVMHFAVVCSDDPIFSLDELVTDGVPAMYRGAQADDALDYATACPLLALPQLPDRYDELAESEIPALMLQGGLDPATGVPVGSTVQEGLPNSTNVIFPASGHIVGNSPCGIALMDAFMRDPAATPDTSCVDPAIPFYLAGPQVVSSPDGSVTLGVTLPDDFGPMGPGGWQRADAIVALNFEEKVTTAEEAAALRLALLSAPAETELVDGPALAGMPSRVGQFLHPQLGDVEVHGFADANRAYTVVIIVTDPSKAEAFRTEMQPALLESVTLDGE